MRTRIGLGERIMGALAWRIKVAYAIDDTLRELSNSFVANAPRQMPGTENEPTHVRYGNAVHYGIGTYGEHLALRRNGLNIHIYPNKIFINPIGSHNGIELDMPTTYSDRIAELISRARGGGQMKAAGIEKLAYVPFVSPLIGRILTNLVVPAGYSVSNQMDSLRETLREPGLADRLIRDQMQSARPTSAIRNQLFRRQFGLPDNGPIRDLIRGDKLRFSPVPSLEPGALKNTLQIKGLSAKTYDDIWAGLGGFLGRFDARTGPGGGPLTYRDVWDFKLNPGEAREQWKQWGRLAREMPTYIRDPYSRERISALAKHTLLNDATLTSRDVANKFINPITVQGQIDPISTTPSQAIRNTLSGPLQPGRRIHMASKPTQYLLNVNNITGNLLSRLRQRLSLGNLSGILSRIRHA